MVKPLSDTADQDVTRQRKEIVDELLGNTREQHKAVNAALMLSALFNPATPAADKGGIIFLLLDLDRLTAFRTLMLLPVVVEDYIDEDELEKALAHYFGLSVWLISWELEKSGTLAENMKILGCEKCEPWAWESECRYRVVRGLCDKNKIPPFKKPAFPWLLTEASNYWISIEERIERLRHGTITNKADFRKEIKAHIDGLKQLPDERNLIDLRGDARMHHFIDEVKTQGALLAQTDKDFEKDPWLIYVKAFTTLNNFFYRHGELKLKKKRPGPNLERKYEKDSKSASKACQKKRVETIKKSKVRKKRRAMPT